MIEKKELEELKKEATSVRKTVVAMIHKAKASHVASSFSVVEILTYLYLRVLMIDPKKPLDPARDRFILSKGWAISALYVLLSRLGFFPSQLLDTYCKDGS